MLYKPFLNASRVSFNLVRNTMNTNNNNTAEYIFQA